MRIEVHDYIDWNSPGTMDPKRGERAPDEGNGDIDGRPVPGRAFPPMGVGRR